MRYSLRIQRKVTRYVQRLQPRLRHQFAMRFEGLAEDPYDPNISEPLSGRWAGHRKSRVGDYRIIFEVRDQELVVLIVRVGPRGDVYKD